MVGRRDEDRGETVQAFVTLKPGTDATPDELIAWCKERMAAHLQTFGTQLSDVGAA